MKIAIILDRSLGVGYAANAAAVLAMSVGKRFPQLVGADVPDGDGGTHRGITSVPIPVLAASAEDLAVLRDACASAAGLWAVDFTRTARDARDYGTYARNLAAAGRAELRYVGLAVAGESAEVKRLTGALPLFK